MSEHVWRWAAAVSVLAGGAFVLLHDGLVLELLWITALTSTCTAIVVGIRGNRPSRAHPWWILLAAFLLLDAGYVLRLSLWAGDLTELLGNLSTLFAYPLIAVAVLSMVRLQAPGGDREGAIDGGIVMIALATLLAGTVFDQRQLAADSELLPRLLMIVAPLLLSAVAAATLRLLFVGAVRIPAAWMLVGAAVGALVGNVARTVYTAQGTYARGSWVELFLLASYAGVALAALHPSVVELSEPSEAVNRRLTLARLGVLGAALIAAPATLVIQDPGDGLSMPVVSSILLSLLVLWRLARLVVEREAVRQALHERADRQEALAAIGLQALDAPELSVLSDEVSRCCARMLDLDVCAVSSEPQSHPGGIRLPFGREGAALIAVREAPWNDEDLAFLQAAANVLAGAFERQRTQEAIRHQAVHDSLTGLPNRVLILDRVEHALARSQRSGSTVSVMFIDLDGFKQVNDEHGHHAGDELLIAVSERLSGRLRDADTLGRLAGDEFVVVCEDTDVDVALQVAERFVAALNEPFQLGTCAVRIGASIGVADADGSVVDPERLLSEADVAMYLAKEQPGSRAVAFDCQIGATRDRRRRLEADLAGAADRGELRLVYQPVVTAAPGPDGSRVVGAEALLRWTHPSEGVIPPSEFIPIADASGLIIPVGDWVMAQASQQLARWCEVLPDAAPFTLWVNLSARQLSDAELPHRVARLLADAAVAPSRFGFEVTETAVLGEEAIPVVASLRGLGVPLALDDFGTGFSSLTHLKRLALDIIKIDRSFVDGVAEAGDDRAIVRAVTAIARELGVSVVGEGVETADQFAALHDLGCEMAQGYLLGRPVPPEQIVLPTVSTPAIPVAPA
jgi:diguanylate cyclase (GGDEF)-like protein